MKPIGNIDAERLRNIPKKHWVEHELCFHIHDLMVSLLIKSEINSYGKFSFEITSQEEKDLLESSNNVLEFLEKTGRGDLERRVVVDHICHALLADMLHFVFEALTALEKRKFTVAYSLLRKPFKEGMLILAQICADEVEFLDKLKRDAKNLLNRRNLNEEKTKEVLRDAIKSCKGASFTSEDALYDSLFNFKNEFGLAGLFDKATHITTEFSRNMTSNYNLNFIFKNPKDNDVYSGDTYKQVAIILLFIHVMQIELHRRSGESDRKYENWMLFTSIGAYEAIYGKGLSPIASLINKDFSELMQCIVCNSRINLKKKDAPRLFISETLECKKCGAFQNFPLRWLLSKTEIEIFD